MVGVLCIITALNFALQIVSVCLNIVYYCWAAFAKWFKVGDNDDLASLKKRINAIEIYVNSVEYTSLAMIPLQICAILLVKCCCNECNGCKKKLEDDDNRDLEFERTMSNFNFKRSEIIL